VTAGRILTYKATTTNLGPSTATDARVRVDLPAGVTYQGVTTSGGPALCGLLTSTVLSCSLGTMAPGGSTSVFVDVLVAPSVADGATLTGTATASSGSNDANLANNVASDSAAVVRSADLAIVLTSDGVVYKPSTIIHYQWTVTNLGPSDAADVVVRQELPSPKTAIYNSNNYGCPAPVGTPPVLTCSLGTIPAGGSVTVQVNVLIRGNKRTVTSTAVVSSTTADPTSVNNTSIRKVTVK
jgi:uncharacterized repeat protein (TIGR01451 family)